MICAPGEINSKSDDDVRHKLRVNYILCKGQLIIYYRTEWPSTTAEHPAYKKFADSFIIIYSQWSERTV